MVSINGNMEIMFHFEIKSSLHEFCAQRQYYGLSFMIYQADIVESSVKSTTGH